MTFLLFFKPILAQRSRYAAPYDSTQGVPDVVFIVAWILILLFLARLAWEFGDKLFGVKRVIPKKPKKKTRKKH